MATINLTITDQRREDMLVGALEGGSNYWYYISNGAVKAIDEVVKPETPTPLAIKMWAAIKAGKQIPIRDAEDHSEKLGYISLSSIEKGEQIMAEKYPEHFMDIVNENDDASTADVWFQLAVMGELVYG